MKDTTPEAAAAFSELLRQRSGSDRVRMASDMFDLARVLVTASVKAAHPEIAEPELRVKVFARLYANDFSPAEHARIAARLRS